MLAIKPERRRWIIVCIIFFATVFNYYDRQVLAVLKPLIKEDFGMDNFGYATIVNLFTITYAIMYIVSGWLVDRFGERKIMLFGIIGWAVSSFGAGISSTLTQFGFFRGLLGVSEPSNFPVKLKTVTIWFSSKLRATANSLAETGSSIGAIIAPPLAAWLALISHWRWAFYVGGVAGILIALMWLLVYKRPPADFVKNDVSKLKKEEAESFSWKQLWSKKSLWGVIMIRFISDPVWYFCLFWLPGYLQEQSGLTLKQMAYFGWIPFLMADLGALGMSSWSDRMVRKGTTAIRSRKIMLTVAACFAPLCVFTTFFPNPFVTIAIFSVVAIICLTWLFNINIIVSETFPVGNVASVLGIAGGFGALGAIIMNYLIAQYIGSVYTKYVFIGLAFLHPISVIILWTIIKKEKTKYKNNQ